MSNLAQAELMNIESADGREMQVFVLAVWSDEVMVVRRDKKEFSLTYDQISQDSLNKLSHAGEADEAGGSKLTVRLFFRAGVNREVDSGETRSTTKFVTKIGANGIPKTETERVREPVMRKVNIPPGCSIMITNGGDKLSPGGLLQWIAYSSDGEPIARGANAMPALGSGVTHPSGISCRDAVGFVIRHYRPESSITLWEKSEGSLSPDLNVDWSGFENVEIQDRKGVRNGKEYNLRRSHISHPDFKRPGAKRPHFADPRFKQP
ncbi:MAG: hypothetical protein AAF585_06035 [Verrucomicrobiota bacterium]